jgi:oligopeptide/dipeptide ABC transporter ATP-binding protein
MLGRVSDPFGRRASQRAEKLRGAAAQGGDPARNGDSTAPYALSVRGLSTEYRIPEGTVQAVRDVSFDLRPRERLGIVGESGSGKSALALSILGLIEPPGVVAAGEIWLKGREISRLSDRRLAGIRGKEIALVLQDPMSALDPVKTIGTQLIQALAVHNPDMGRAAARKRATELLREVDIPQAERRLEDYPHQYSGGMRQRVAIAMAIANNPDVLIADEPTTALDVTTQAQVIALLDRLVEEYEAAVILITHNLGIVSEFCDSVAVMYAGRFVETAASDHIFKAPTHPYSEALLRCVPNPEKLAEGPLPAIPGFPPNLAELPGGCSFAPRCPLGRDIERCHAEAPAAHKVTGPEGPAVVECHFAEQRIAEVTEP